MAFLDPPLDRARALLRSDDEPTRLTAVHLLRDGNFDDAADDADAAARLLIDSLLDPGSYVPHAARAALSDLGAVAHAALFDAARSDDPRLRTQAVWALAIDAGDAAPRVVDVLARCAADPDATVRHAVAGALGRVGSCAAPVTDALRRLAIDAEPRVRAEALASLGLALTDASAVADALFRALDDGAPAVRSAAATALTRLVADAAQQERVRVALAEECHEATALELRILLEHWESRT